MELQNSLAPTAKSASGGPDLAVSAWIDWVVQTNPTSWHHHWLPNLPHTGRHPPLAYCTLVLTRALAILARARACTAILRALAILARARACTASLARARACTLGHGLEQARAWLKKLDRIWFVPDWLQCTMQRTGSGRCGAGLGGSETPAGEPTLENHCSVSIFQEGTIENHCHVSIFN